MSLVTRRTTRIGAAIAAAVVGIGMSAWFTQSGYPFPVMELIATVALAASVVVLMEARESWGMFLRTLITVAFAWGISVTTCAIYFPRFFVNAAKTLHDVGYALING